MYIETEHMNREDASVAIRTRNSALLINGGNIVDKLVKTGRLRQETLEYLISHVPALQSSFPGAWDIQFEFGINSIKFVNRYGHNSNLENTLFKGIKVTKTFFVIHLPKVAITNERSQYLELTDLFVRLPLTLNEVGLPKEFTRLEGTRTTLSANEAVDKYAHSHLSSINYASYNYTRFCVGTGDILSVTSLLNSNVHDLNIFSLYLESVKTFVAYESIEGNPYKFINNVLLGSRTLIISNSTAGASQLYENLMLQVERKELVPNLTWAFDSDKNRYYIIDNEHLENFLLKQTRYSPATQGIVFCYRGSDGTSYLYDRKREVYTQVKAKAEHPENYIIFKNKKIYLTVMPPDESSDTDKQLSIYITPSIKKYVIEHLEATVNEQAITKAATNKLSAPNYR